MILSCADPITLRAGPYTAVLAPAAGGRVASLVWSSGEATQALLVEWEGADFDEHQWPKAGAFPMLPFANRLPPGGFLFGGRRIEPEAGPGGVAVHGWAHRRPWQVIEATSDRAVLQCVHDGRGAGWPWAWTARQHVTLGDRGLSVVLSVTNDSPEPMPLAMGWHPYHVVEPAVQARDLAFLAGARHELDAEGRAMALEMPPVFAMQRGETAAFARWQGAAELRLRHGAITVASASASGLVLHRPPSGDYVCIEPVTALPGQLGQAASTGEEPGLLAGQSRSITWRCGFAA